MFHLGKLVDLKVKVCRIVNKEVKYFGSCTQPGEVQHVNGFDKYPCNIIWWLRET